LIDYLTLIRKRSDTIMGDMFEWAFLPRVIDENYFFVNDYLVRTEDRIFHKNIYASHITRKFEYPWAFLNSQLKKSDVVLDAGGGLGLIQYMFADIAAQVFNVDNRRSEDFEKYDKIFIDKFRSLIGETYHNLFFVSEDISCMSFEDDFFDKVFCLSVLEHNPVENQVEIVTELVRVLKPGGALIVTMDVMLDEKEQLNDAKNICKLLDISFEYPSNLSTLFHIDGKAYYILCLRKVKQ